MIHGLTLPQAIGACVATAAIVFFLGLDALTGRRRRKQARDGLDAIGAQAETFSAPAPPRPPAGARPSPPEAGTRQLPWRAPLPGPRHIHGGVRCRITLYTHAGAAESQTVGYWCGCAHSFDATGRLVSAEPCRSPDWDDWLKDLTS